MDQGRQPHALRRVRCAAASMTGDRPPAFGSGAACRHQRPSANWCRSAHRRPARSALTSRLSAKAPMPREHLEHPAPITKLRVWSKSQRPDRRGRHQRIAGPDLISEWRRGRTDAAHWRGRRIRHRCGSDGRDSHTRSRPRDAGAVCAYDCRALRPQPHARRADRGPGINAGSTDSGSCSHR